MLHHFFLQLHKIKAQWCNYPCFISEATELISVTTGVGVCSVVYLRGHLRNLPYTTSAQKTSS